MSPLDDELRWYVRLMKLAHELAMEGRGQDAQDVGSDVHGLLIVPAGTLGMDMGGGCSEKDNVACA